MRLVALVRQRPDLTLVPPAGLRLTLGGEQGSGSGSGIGRGRIPGSRIPIARSRIPVADPEPRVPDARSRKGASRPTAPPSWWTARARAGEVQPGFTKEEILRPAKDDPRRPGGVFERVGGLLSELLDTM